MNDGNRKEPNREDTPQLGRVYAPTHAGGSGLNLRPFQKNKPEPEEEHNAPAPAAQPAAPATADEPLPEAPALLADEMQQSIVGPALHEQAQDAPDKPHRPTVREEKRRARRLTEREKKRRERRRRMVRLLSIAVFAVIGIAALLLTYFILIIDKIEVYGAERFTNEEILAASGLHTGQHMWLANYNAAKAAVEADPYIAALDITRVYPDKLVLRVTERVEKAVIMGMNTHAVVDGEGYVLSIGTRANYEGLMKVYGTGAGGYHVNQRLGEESDFHSRTLVTLLAALAERSLMDTVETLDISNPLSITMTTFDGLTLQFGQPENVEEKLNNFRIVLPTLIQNGYNKSGTLDLSAKGSPVYSPPASQQTIPIDPIDPADPTAPGQSPDPNAPGTPGTPQAPSPTTVPDDPYSG